MSDKTPQDRPSPALPGESGHQSDAAARPSGGDHSAPSESAAKDARPSTDPATDLPTEPPVSRPSVPGSTGQAPSAAQDTQDADVTEKRPAPASMRAQMSASRAAPVQPHFSQPVRQILLMLIVLGLVIAGGWFAYGRIFAIFAANPWLNGIILGVFVLGVLACFWQVAQLVQSVSWIERFAARRRDQNQGAANAEAAWQGDRAPRLLAPLAALLGARGPSGGAISTGSARSILDSVATRIDEARDITKYLANLLIFLGLLGTFYGLATTVPAVVDTIRALAPQEGESGLQVFDKLMSGLESQLGGMAVAFSSSLLGLAGSLVVGLLELFATHGQNRFYRELEEWMSGFTRLGLAGPDGEDTLDQAALAAFLDQMIDQMDRLNGYYAERDQIREQEAIEADERVLLTARNLEKLGEHLRNDSEAHLSRAAALGSAMERLAQGQDRVAGAQDQLIALQERLAGGQERIADGQDQLNTLQERAIAHQAELISASAAAPAQDTDDAVLSLLAKGQEQMILGQDRLTEAQTQMVYGQQELAAIAARIAHATEAAAQAPAAASRGDDTGLDAADGQTRMHLRSIDNQLGRIAEEMALGRQDMMVELRADLAHIARAVQRSGGGGAGDAG